MMTWGGRVQCALLGLAAAAFGGSLVVLGVVLARVSQGPTAPAAASAGDLPPLTAPGGRPLTYLGLLPSALAGLGLAERTGAAPADLAFALARPGDPAAITTRYWVPVASLSAGVDALTRTQWDLLFSGDETVTWAALGGVGGRPELLSAGPLEDLAALATLSPVAVGRVGGYEELFRMLATPGTGYAAMVPLDQLRLGGVAIAIDGLDIVRGAGSPTEWPFAERVTVTAATSAGNTAIPDVRARIEASVPVVTRVVATGDILQSRCALAQIKATGDWASALRGPVAEYLAAADLALGSLDGSIQDVNPPYLCVPGTNLSSPPEVMAALTLAGFDGVTVATNHVFDCGTDYCGTKAFLQTLDRLHAEGIKTVGGGRTLDEALAPAVFEVNGLRFGVLGFDDVAAMDLEATSTAPGTAPLDDDYAEERAAGEPAFYRPAADLGLERFTASIRALKAQVDVVIVQVQSGTEDTHKPTERSIKALRAAADAGADVVVGNQAHWVQAAEVRGQAFVAYALGNFVFDQTHTPEHTQGYLLESTFHGKRLVTIRLIPYEIEQKYRPVLATGDLRAKVLNDVFVAAKGLPTK